MARVTAGAPDLYAIDFGTSNSLLAAASSDRIWPPVALDPSSSDPTILRSVLYFPPERGCFHGARALREYFERGMEGRLIRSIKRHLGSRTFTSTHIGGRSVRLEELV